MPNHKQEDEGDGREMDDAEGKPIAKAIDNPGKLSRFIHPDARKNGQEQNRDDGGIDQAMPGVNFAFGVGAHLEGFQVVGADKPMLPAAGHQDIHAVPQEVEGENPHGSKMPVSPACQPAPQQKKRGKVPPFATAEHRIGVVNLQAAHQHDRQTDGVHPMEGFR